MPAVLEGLSAGSCTWFPLRHFSFLLSRWQGVISSSSVLIWCVWAFAYMTVLCTTCVPGAQGDQKRALEAPELGLQKVISCPMVLEFLQQISWGSWSLSHFCSAAQQFFWYVFLFKALGDDCVCLSEVVPFSWAYSHLNRMPRMSHNLNELLLSVHVRLGSACMHTCAHTFSTHLVKGLYVTDFCRI